MQVGDGWIHTWKENGQEFEAPVYGTPDDTGAIYDPRSPTDPVPYLDAEWNQRYTFEQIHPNGIPRIEGRLFDH